MENQKNIWLTLSDAVLILVDFFSSYDLGTASMV
jgi:hypothetical protein